MKKILLLTLILLTTLSSFAQGFTNYKAVIADDSGTVLGEQTVTVRFTIYDDDPNTTGVQVFQETQTTTTDTNGILVLNIGEENPMDWFAIDWSIPRQYLQVEYDTGSGFIDMGTQTLNSVPYSEYAYKAQNSRYSEHADEVDFNDITNVPAGLSDGDDNTQLTETQVDDYVANNGYLTTEVDGDTTNELQTISKTGSTVTLSDGGGSFTDDNTQLTETEVDDFISNNGYATELNDLSDAKSDGSSIFIGENAGLNDDSTTNRNIGIGAEVLRRNTSGNHNVANGYYSLYYNTSGNNNIAIGYEAGFNNDSGSSNIFLGYNAGYYESGSNKLYIDNSDNPAPLIGGDFATDEVTINGTLKITGGSPGNGKVFTSNHNGKGSWQTPVDNDTQLTEAQVDDFVSNNGYLTAEDKILVLSPLNARVQHLQEDVTNYLDLSTQGVCINSTTRTQPIYFPINLPVNSTIQSIDVVFYDNSTRNFKFSVKKKLYVSGGEYASDEFTTSGNTTSVQTASINVNKTITDDTFIYLRVGPISGDTWDNNNFTVKAIKIYYHE